MVVTDSKRTAIVAPTAESACLGVLRFAGRSWRCALGRFGIRHDKREGDGATPAGIWPMRRILHRADRLSLPARATPVPLAAISPDDGWCDAPDDPNYNRFVTHPYPASAERLWRDDGLYDIVAVLGHNDDPVVPGGGSAIFLHVASADYAPTAGCVALALADLVELLTLPPGLSALRIEPRDAKRPGTAKSRATVARPRGRSGASRPP